MCLDSLDTSAGNFWTPKSVPKTTQMSYFDNCFEFFDLRFYVRQRCHMMP